MRAKKIDELLERPAYAAWWATKLSDMTGNSDKNGALGGEQRFTEAVELADEVAAQVYRS